MQVPRSFQSPRRRDNSRAKRCNRSGRALFAEIRVAYDGALSIVCDGSRMPLPGNIDISHGRGGQGIQIHNPVETA